MTARATATAAYLPGAWTVTTAMTWPAVYALTTLRLKPTGRFAPGDRIGEIAQDLRVTESSVRRWRRAWQDGCPSSSWA